jgi:hypothetical protein
MKPLISSKWAAIIGLLLALPAGYVICISLLKYALGIDGPFDASQPTLESWGIKDPPGWNITLLVLLGPVAAVLLSLFQVLAVKAHFGKEQFDFQISIQKKWFPLFVMAISVTILALLLLYLLGENCSCAEAYRV